MSNLVMTIAYQTQDGWVWSAGEDRVYVEPENDMIQILHRLDSDRADYWLMDMLEISWIFV